MADQAACDCAALRRDLERLRRELAATRAWCEGLEDEQARLLSMLHLAGVGPLPQR
jgi:hypothetical protein